MDKSNTNQNQRSRHHEDGEPSRCQSDQLIGSGKSMVPSKPGDPGDQTGDNASSGDVSTGVDTIQRLEKPKMYKVILANDDFTPMDFVVHILKRFFSKTEDQANQIMLDVHKKGAGIAGVYTLEIGEMKAMQVNQFSRTNQHPLKCNLEPE